MAAQRLQRVPHVPQHLLPPLRRRARLAKSHQRRQQAARVQRRAQLRASRGRRRSSTVLSLLSTAATGRAHARTHACTAQHATRNTAHAQHAACMAPTPHQLAASAGACSPAPAGRPSQPAPPPAALAQTCTPAAGRRWACAAHPARCSRQGVRARAWVGARQGHCMRVNGEHQVGRRKAQEACDNQCTGSRMQASDAVIGAAPHRLAPSPGARIRYSSSASWSPLAAANASSSSRRP